MLVMGYATRPYSPDCLDGEVVTGYPDYDFQCLNGRYVQQPKTEKEKAIIAKQAKKDFEARYAKEEQFCGKGNVAAWSNDVFECMDYSLVPDENLK